MMKKDQIVEWLHRSKYEDPPKKLILEIADQIKNKTYNDEEELIFLILILGRSGAKEYRLLIEQILYNTQSDDVARAALKTLCDYWDLTADYLELIKEFIRGVEWDSWNDVFILALDIAGEYLAKHDDQTLLQLIVDVFEDGKNAEEDDDLTFFYAGCAYNSFLLALGKTWEELPDVEEVAKVIQQKRYDFLDQKVLEKIYRRLHPENYIKRVK